MGWMLKRFWDVVIVAALLALLGGAALMQAAMGTGGVALGQGLSGGVTFVKAITGGFQDAEAVSPQNLDELSKKVEDAAPPPAPAPEEKGADN